jgi:hypothetical protein
MFFLDQLVSVKETRSLGEIFLFRESEKGLKKTRGVSFFVNNFKARKRDKPKPGRMALFHKFSPSGPKKGINVYLRILS